METIDLTSLRPKDSRALLAAWRETGVLGHQRSQPYLLYLWMPEDPKGGHPITFTGANGVTYKPSANIELHLKRSDKAKIHNFLLTVSYKVTERGGGYTLSMNSRCWGNLNEVPNELPAVFPNKGESAYDALLSAYSTFWRGFVRPFTGTRHQDLHGDNSNEEN